MFRLVWGQKGISVYSLHLTLAAALPASSHQLAASGFRLKKPTSSFGFFVRLGFCFAGVAFVSSSCVIEVGQRVLLSYRRVWRTIDRSSDSLAPFYSANTCLVEINQKNSWCFSHGPWSDVIFFFFFSYLKKNFCFCLKSAVCRSANPGRSCVFCG